MLLYVCTFAQMLCDFVLSFVIVLVFVRFAHCNFYFYIVFVLQIDILLVFVLIERRAIILVFVFVFVFVTKNSFASTTILLIISAVGNINPLAPTVAIWVRL